MGRNPETFDMDIHGTVRLSCSYPMLVLHIQVDERITRGGFNTTSGSSGRIPGTIGLVERYHTPLRAAFTKIREELDRVTYANCLSMAVFAYNSTTDPDGWRIYRFKSTSRVGSCTRTKLHGCIIPNHLDCLQCIVEGSPELSRCSSLPTRLF